MSRDGAGPVICPASLHFHSYPQPRHVKLTSKCSRSSGNTEPLQHLSSVSARCSLTGGQRVVGSNPASPTPHSETEGEAPSVSSFRVARVRSAWMLVAPSAVG